jgi:GNAT superfamily N-acetyltransferase
VHDTIAYKLNPPIDAGTLDSLYGAAWPAHTPGFDFARVLSRSVAYVSAFDGARLVGSVYVAWDGAQHAFLLEPTVHPEYQHRGIGSELVRRATGAWRDAGCDWLHVDFEPRLAAFYDACGFTPTPAGLIRLRA